jgi:HK97 family phage major capsid protein/HK97 family phage prohead protease
MTQQAHSLPWQAKPPAAPVEKRTPEFIEADGQVRFKLPQMVRALTGDDLVVDAGSRTMTMSFSSELPVERWFGNEVLSHAAGAADLSRLNDGAPLLFNHNMDDIIGVVEKASIDSKAKRGTATVRFADTPMANEVMGMVNDKIMRNVSFGYRINEMDVQDAKSDMPTYVATSWTPFEISLVSVPADPSVGVGRAEAVEERDVIVRRDHQPAAAAAKPDEVTMTQETTAAAPAVNIETVRGEAVAAERARIATISALGAKFGNEDLARSLVDSGKSIDEARAAFLEKIGTKAPVAEGAADLPMTEKEKRDYSLVRALRAQVTGNWKDAGFERECSEAIAKRTGKESAGFFMPMNISMRNASSSAYAVGTAGSGTTGGTLVATNLLASEFIEVLRNKARVVQLGARMLTGLVGNVDIPRQTAQTATYWVSEGADVTEAEAAFDKITLSPKTIGARSQITRNMMMQSTPDIEMVVRNDLAQVLALGIDLAAISGTGSSGQPTGILNTSGIGSVVGGTNGANITIDHLIALETAVTAANAPEDALAYLTNAKVIGSLKGLKSTTGQYLWTDSPIGQRSGTPGEINGYTVARSNQVSSTGTKGTSSGNCSTVVFGDWSELFIGEWGVLEILPNPYGAGYNNGSIDIRALQSVDIGARHVKSFSAMTDALTP